MHLSYWMNGYKEPTLDMYYGYYNSVRECSALVLSDDYVLEAPEHGAPFLLGASVVRFAPVSARAAFTL